MHLIRKEPRTKTTKEGHTVTEHWDGRQDVNIKATTQNVRFSVQGDDK